MENFQDSPAQPQAKYNYLLIIWDSEESYEKGLQTASYGGTVDDEARVVTLINMLPEQAERQLQFFQEANPENYLQVHRVDDATMFKYLMLEEDYRDEFLEDEVHE